VPTEELLEQLHTSLNGLGKGEVLERRARSGANLIHTNKRSGPLRLFLAQFKSPITLILLGAAILSLFLHDPTDALIIIFIVLISSLLGFWQEHKATGAVNKLLALVRVKAEVMRGGESLEVPVEELVPGDMVILSAGRTVPGDSILLEANNLFVDEATLTGETYPVEKITGVLTPETPLSKRSNTLFMGTHIVSGWGKAAVVHTGRQTEFGRISERLTLRSPETEFERGIKKFGYFLMEVTSILVIIIFAVNVILARHVLDSFLFSLALAVGLTPQLLPAIISINLAHGANRMAGKKVIVKRLSSIENLGSMNTLCSDKTGTLTEGVVQLHDYLDCYGNRSEKVVRHAYINASFESGFANPIDDAIRATAHSDLSGYGKLDELPYDFIRKRLSILVSCQGKNVLMTKGAVDNILSVCIAAESADGTLHPIAEVRDEIRRHYETFSAQGYRLLGVAYRDLTPQSKLMNSSESSMIFLGFVVFSDPPKAQVMETIQRLRDLGVSLKIITGDNHLVASTISRQVGLPDSEMLTGGEIRHMSDEALLKRVNEVGVFAEVEPNQKERIILSLKKSGNVVGFMGDGINDASALHAADVGISVDGAVDVAKEVSDIVLLEKDLKVLVDGVEEGRRTFANTIKYVFMATSANFGNMFSMAGASLFLPFLPLLPKQILLTNLLTDFPEMTIASDSVDAEMVEKPRRWDIGFIRSFMTTFGVVSSLFDYLAFGVFLLMLHATVDQFRTGWFVESVISASLVVLVVRTRKPFFRSRPSIYLMTVTILIVLAGLIVPFTPFAGILGFEPLPPLFLVAIVLIVVAYMMTAELVKKIFFARVRF
jgi:Mg2+-importing ATPase